VKEKGMPLQICEGFSMGFTPACRAPASSVVNTVTANSPAGTRGWLNPGLDRRRRKLDFSPIKEKGIIGS